MTRVKRDPFDTSQDDEGIKYAGALDWQDIMKNRSRLKMHELIERLGLRAKWSSNKRGKTNFDSPLVKELVTDMTNVVATLPKETDDLIKALATPESLKDEVDLLMDKHGSAIWGRMGDREHLVSVGEPEVETFFYPRDLYFENEEDRKLIRTLLHWWIGLKACNVILARDRLDRERRKKEERLRSREDHGSPREPNPTVLIAPATRLEPASEPTSALEQQPQIIPYNQPPRHIQLRLDTSYSNPISPISGTPLHSAETPAQGSSNAPFHDFNSREMYGSRRPSALSHSQSIPLHGGPEVRHSSTPPLPSLHQLSSELGCLVSHFLEEGNAADLRTQMQKRSPSPGGHQIARGETVRDAPVRRELDPETLLAFRSYIYPGESGPKWDEEVLLRRLETVWRDNIRTGQQLAAGDTALFAVRDRAFLTWIELRRHLADLDRADKRWRQEGNLAEGMEARIAQHKTLMSASRDLVRNWEDIAQGVTVAWAPEGLTADDLLLQAFEQVAGEKGSALQWVNMNVNETIRWIKGHLEQFAEDQVDMEEGLLYVRT